MARLDHSKITPDQGALTALSGLIFDEVLRAQTLEELFNVFYGVRDGQKAVFVGDFGLAGKAAQGCNPNYDDSLIGTREQEWNIEMWGIYEKLCYDVVQEIMEQWGSREGITGDLTSSEYVRAILEPAMVTAVRNAVMRFVWFGDKAAATVADGGNIKDAANLPYFNVTDGFWKKLDEIVAADSDRLTAVAANEATTPAAQKTAMLQAGVATGIMNTMITSASPTLRGLDGVIYITQAFKDALDFDLQQNNKGSELQWRSLFDGVQEAYYQGIRLLAVPFMDQIIQAYEGVSGNTSYNRPYRAVYTTKNNMGVGVYSNSELAEVRVHFDDTTELNYLKAKDGIGTMILNPELVQVAY